MRARLFLASGISVAAVCLVPKWAEACGGCFALPPPPQHETSVVTGHRMAFAVSATRTVLWDQFQYSGSPEDFSWVLPIKPGAYVEESTDAWFEALDSFTATRIQSPQVTCSGDVGTAGCTCGGASSDESASAGGNQTNPPAVSVIHEGTVGPYQTVTLHSVDPEALRDWLNLHSYIVPPEINPIIDAYVAEGFDFLALRLLPNVGVQQMTPVRVITPGGDYELPLRMVAAGVGSFVDITLFVIGEGRFQMPDLPELSVDHDQLEWDFATQSSNYGKLRGTTLLQNGGKTYITTFARKGALFQTLEQPPPTIGPQTIAVTGANGQILNTTSFCDLYFAQAAANANELTGPCSLSMELELTSTELVQECETPPCSLGTTRSDAFECSGFSDIAAAVIGMHPSDVWISRLEMRLPTTALDADCVLEPSPNQHTVDNAHVARSWRNSPCGDPIFTGSEQASFGFASVLSAWLLRRARRRRK